MYAGTTRDWLPRADGQSLDLPLDRFIISHAGNLACIKRLRLQLMPLAASSTITTRRVVDDAGPGLTVGPNALAELAEAIKLFPWQGVSLPASTSKSIRQNARPRCWKLSANRPEGGFLSSHRVTPTDSE